MTWFRRPTFQLFLSFFAAGFCHAQRPLGIDVSSYQGGSIGWASVKNSGVSFAWAKATEGLTVNDADFTINEANAKAVGVLIGAYHFAHPELHIGTAGADQEAAHFWSVAAPYVKSGGAYLLPMLDIEQDLSSASPPYTKTTLSQWVNRWCQDIVNSNAANGLVLKPIVYTYISYANSWMDGTVTQWPLWMANYNGQDPQTGAPNSVSPWGKWVVWQYSSTAAVPGVSGNCDVDVFNGTAAALIPALVVGASAPMITSSPQSISAPVGGSATFRVSATGTGPLRYQWSFNQTPLAGATASSYTISSVQLSHAGGYSVTVTNNGGPTVTTPAFLSVIAPLANAPGSILAPPNLVNWWPGDANGLDIFGGITAVPHFGVSYVSGKQNLAFHFDGASSYLSTGASSISPPWTACMWVNRQNAPGTGAAIMGDGNYELKIEQYNGTRKLGITQFGVGDYLFNYTVPVGVWTHVAFVGQTTGTSLYINGVFQSTLTNTLPLPRAYLGAGYVNSSAKFVDYYLGGLDEILCFNRALSGSELGAIYSAGSGGLVRAPEFTTATGPTNQQFGFSVRGETGKSFTFYTSTNLVSWRSLGTVANPTGSLQFFDTTATNSQSFYRATQP